MGNNELYHYGVIGMKWGKRKGLSSTPRFMMPRMVTAKRQLAADKKTLDKMNKGDYHVSVGLTKKRQAEFDKRDKRILEKRIEKNKRSTEKLIKKIGRKRPNKDDAVKQQHIQATNQFMDQVNLNNHLMTMGMGFM